MSRSSSVDALSIEEVVHGLIAYGMPCSTLLGFATFCRSLWHTSHAVQRHMFTPHCFLRALFPNIADYDDIQKSNDLLITGVPILRYMTDFVVHRAELVLIATPRILFRVFSLLSSNGYVLDSVHRTSMSDPDIEPIRDAYCFRLRGAGPLIWVQVPKRSVTHVFLSQRSTLLLNGIYRQRFFSLCPRASILHRQGVVLHRRLFIHQEPGEPVAQPGGNPYGLTRIAYSFRTSRIRGLHVTLSPSPRAIGDRWSWFPCASDASPDDNEFWGHEWDLAARVHANGAIGIYVSPPPFTRGPDWSAAYVVTPSRYLVPALPDAITAESAAPKSTPDDEKSAAVLTPPLAVQVPSRI